ncbi:hypothetical protein COLO4_21777 [Corchorus olitorius]|uniref:Uncharacterized protein n=1 Tax=Corchorus olitorius TaxID=93759 RepID=A0A1R3IR50_9ROSI|nr:hypothetical protein COLO4_21777 [Corchorus olitorius]
MRLFAGRYAVHTFADASFIQMCLWERFPACAPLHSIHTEGENYRAWAWYGYIGKESVLSHMDRATSFTARPYLEALHGFEDPDAYSNQPAALANFQQWVYRRELPALIEGDRYKTVERYLPYRVAIQFGFDQGVPPPPGRVGNVTACFASHTWGNMLSFPRIVIPPRTRACYYSNGWIAFYQNSIAEWREYSKHNSQLKSALTVKKVMANDIFLHMMIKKPFFPVVEDPVMVTDTDATPTVLPMTGPGVSSTISHVADVAAKNTFVFATITISTRYIALGSPTFGMTAASSDYTTFGTTAASAHHTTFSTTRSQLSPHCLLVCSVTAHGDTILPSDMTVTRGVTRSAVTFSTSSESASAFSLFASTSSTTVDFHGFQVKSQHATVTEVVTPCSVTAHGDTILPSAMTVTRGVTPDAVTFSTSSESM